MLYLIDSAKKPGLLLGLAWALTFFLHQTEINTQDRAACLEQFRKFEGLALKNASLFFERLQKLQESPLPYLMVQEAAWLLVPALSLEYRLRKGDSPAECFAVLAAMGLFHLHQADKPIHTQELAILLQKAALPETEILLPEPRPLPLWLWR